jgi:putative ABC transport system ATP-binding protein
VANEWGRAVVMVTHDAHVASYADRIIFLKDGVIVEERIPDPAGNGRAD